MRRMSQHVDWKIGVTTRELEGEWRARVEVYPPGRGPRTHTGRSLTFRKAAATEGEIIALARKYANAWIDRNK